MNQGGCEKFRILVVQLPVEWQNGTDLLKWQNNIKTDVRKMLSGDVDRSELGFVTAVMTAIQQCRREHNKSMTRSIDVL